MSIWDDFSDDELFVLLECDDLKEVKRKFRHKYNRERWKKYARKYYDIDHHNNFFPESFFHSLNSAANYALLTFLSIIGSITLLLLPLSILAGALSLATIVTGIIYFVIAYKTQQRDNHNAEKEFDFLALKIQCENEIICRKKSDLGMSLQHAPGIEAPPFEYKNKYKFEKVGRALSFGLLAGCLLFGPYYTGIAIIIHSLGGLAIAGAMLGPIGISVGLGVALLIGIYCGYKHYQSIVKADKAVKFKEHQRQIIKDKHAECYDLLKKTSNLNPEPHSLSRTHSTPDIVGSRDDVSKRLNTRFGYFHLNKDASTKNKSKKIIAHEDTCSSDHRAKPN